jgi:cobalamin biosynthesis Mg chelatase CobN
MDNKKDLKPELKEIYERVMNTKPTARQTTPTETPKSEVKETQPLPESPELKPEPFLASSAPRPVKDTGGFVFSSNQQAATTKKKEEDNESKHVTKESQKTPTTAKKSNLLPIVIGLLVVFTVVYTIFWAFYLGII